MKEKRDVDEAEWKLDGVWGPLSGCLRNGTISRERENKQRLQT